MKVLGTDIFLVRGDTISLTVRTKTQDGKNKVLNNIDHKVYFTVKKNASDKNEVIPTKELVIENGVAKLYIQASETKELQFGVYYYDIELVETIEGQDFVTTIVPKSKFVIEEEITN